MVFDPTYPFVDYDAFPDSDWTEFYGKVEETIPPNAPAPRDWEVQVRMYVDSDHAGDKQTR